MGAQALDRVLSATTHTCVCTNCIWRLCLVALLRPKWSHAAPRAEHRGWGVFLLLGRAPGS